MLYCTTLCLHKSCSVIVSFKMLAKIGCANAPGPLSSASMGAAEQTRALTTLLVGQESTQSVWALEHDAADWLTERSDKFKFKLIVTH